MKIKSRAEQRKENEKTEILRIHKLGLPSIQKEKSEIKKERKRREKQKTRKHVY